jgi:hypothetical protein
MVHVKNPLAPSPIPADAASTIASLGPSGLSAPVGTIIVRRYSALPIRVPKASMSKRQTFGFASDRTEVRATQFEIGGVDRIGLPAGYASQVHTRRTQAFRLSGGPTVRAQSGTESGPSISPCRELPTTALASEPGTFAAINLGLIPAGVGTKRSRMPSPSFGFKDYMAGGAGGHISIVQDSRPTRAPVTPGHPRYPGGGR